MHFSRLTAGGRIVPALGESENGVVARQVVATLKAKVEALQTELAKLEATATSHRADFECERERADRLMAELLRARRH
jgi:molecular chaperone GrpE (heat shock protein)